MTCGDKGDETKAGCCEAAQAPATAAPPGKQGLIRDAVGSRAWWASLDQQVAAMGEYIAAQSSGPQPGWQKHLLFRTDDWSWSISADMREAMRTVDAWGADLAGWEIEALYRANQHLRQTRDDDAVQFLDKLVARYRTLKGIPDPQPGQSKKNLPYPQDAFSLLSPPRSTDLSEARRQAMRTFDEWCERVSPETLLAIGRANYALLAGGDADVVAFYDKLWPKIKASQALSKECAAQLLATPSYTKQIRPETRQAMKDFGKWGDDIDVNLLIAIGKANYHLVSTNDPDVVRFYDELVAKIKALGGGQECA